MKVLFNYYVRAEVRISSTRGEQRFRAKQYHMTVLLSSIYALRFYPQTKIDNQVTLYAQSCFKMSI